MIITISGTKKEVADDFTVADLIINEKVEEPLYVTVSINDDLVSRNDFGTRILAEDDTVEFLYFMGGGDH